MRMPGCPIIRLTKHKDARSLSGALGHHLRAIPTHNADPGRTPDNVVLIGADTPATVCADVMTRTKDLVKRKDANRAIELFLGASDDYWTSPGASWMDLAEGLRTWLIKEFGEANVVGFGAHLDETKPHFWAVITPITPDGRLSSAHWFDGPAKLSKMQDRIAEHLAPLGLERARKGVKATHIEVATWHEAQAGNKAAAKLIEREMQARHRDARVRAEKAEKEATKVEARAAAARAKLAKAEEEAASILSKAKAAAAVIAHKAQALWAEVTAREKRLVDREQQVSRLFEALPKEEQIRAGQRLEDLQASLRSIEPEKQAAGRFEQPRRVGFKTKNPKP